MNIKGRREYRIENKILIGKKLPFQAEGGNIGNLLLQKMKENENLVGQVDAQTGETFTFGRIANESIHCAIWLKKQGVGTGDIISIVSDNNITAWIISLAVLYVGANLNPLSNKEPDDDMRHSLNIIKPKIIFVHEISSEVIKNIVKKEKIDTKIVEFGKIPRPETFDTLIKEATEDEVFKFQSSSVNSNSDALILHSSGTTGLPKCILFSYESLYQNVFKYKDMLRASRGLMMLCPIFFGRATSFSHGLVSIISGSTAIIMTEPTSEDLCKVIEKYKVQTLMLRSAALTCLSKSSVLMEYNLSSIKYILHGGAKFTADVGFLNQVLLNSEMLQGYAMAESFIQLLMQEPSEMNPGSIGTLDYNIEMKVLDINTGEILGPKESGELCFKYPYIMKDYYTQESENVIDSEGWLHTGDLGYYDEEGYVYLTDRIKELIKYGSHFISPAEIEYVLHKHPDVIDVAVVGIPDGLNAQQPIVFVIKKYSAKVSEEELVQLTSKLGENNKLQGRVIFLEKFPYTFSMKINRQKLKEMAKSLIR